MRFRSGWCMIALGLVAGIATAQSFPDGPGKEVFEAVCSLCHSPTHVIGKQLTRAQWAAKVLEMLQEDPEVGQEDRDIIVEYLAKNFPAPAKINATRAASK